MLNANDKKITFKKSLFIDYELRSDAYEMARNFLVVGIQHGTGGVLATFSLLPNSILNWLGLTRDATNAMACHGALFETGYELQDYIIRLYQFLFVKDGRKRTPVTFLIVMTLHHFAGFFIVIPLNMKYRDSKVFHELILMLQLAACLSLILQNYGYILNVESKGGLFRMQIVSVLNLISLTWSRVVRYSVLSFYLISHSLN